MKVTIATPAIQISTCHSEQNLAVVLIGLKTGTYI